MRACGRAKKQIQKNGWIFFSSPDEFQIKTEGCFSRCRLQIRSTGGVNSSVTRECTVTAEREIYASSCV